MRAAAVLETTSAVKVVKKILLLIAKFDFGWLSLFPARGHLASDAIRKRRFCYVVTEQMVSLK